MNSKTKESKKKDQSAKEKDDFSDEVLAPFPNLNLPQYVFVLSQESLSEKHAEARTALMKGIEDDEMAPYLASLQSVLGPNEDLLQKLRAKNESTLESIKVMEKDAIENLGETELSDALKARANYLARIGDIEAAVPAHAEAISKTLGLGSKIDLSLSLVRMGFFSDNTKLIATNMESTSKLIDESGDWDRRNRLKIYRGIHSIQKRNFKAAATLFLEALSTCTATELLTFDEFVSLTVLSCMMGLSRAQLKEKVMKNSEIIQVMPNLKYLQGFASSLYNSEYAVFFQKLADVEIQFLLPSKLLAPHAHFYVKEARIIAYAQLLESYSSVTLSSLARAFGVTENFIDGDISKHIASGRLNAVIDKVNGVVETNRPDARNNQYELVIKQGDGLLNQLQKLSRVMN